MTQANTSSTRSTSTTTSTGTEYDTITVTFDVVESWLKTIYDAVLTTFSQLTSVLSTITIYPNVYEAVGVARPMPSCVLAKTSDTPSVQLNVVVVVDSSYQFGTPFSMSMQGVHTLNAQYMTWWNNVPYYFDHWEDEAQRVVSTRQLLLYYPQLPGRTFYAIYSPARPSVVSYTVTFYIADSSTGKAIKGASVTLDGTTSKTDNYGRVLFRTSRGSHSLVVSNNGYNTYTTAININSTTFRVVWLTPS